MHVVTCVVPKVARLSQTLWTTTMKNFYHPNQLNIKCVVLIGDQLYLSVSSPRRTGLTSLVSDLFIKDLKIMPVVIVVSFFYHYIPVSTGRRFDVHTTSITLKRRRTDVKTTSCAYWDIFLI